MKKSKDNKKITVYITT